MANEKRMEITIKGVRFSGTAGQFERALTQVMQMVGAQAQLPLSALSPVQPPAIAQAQPTQPVYSSMVPMTATTIDRESAQYAIAPAPFATPAVPQQMPQQPTQENPEDVARRMFALLQWECARNADLSTVTDYPPQTAIDLDALIRPPTSQPGQSSALQSDVIDMDTLIREPVDRAAEQANKHRATALAGEQANKLHHRRQLRQQALQWLAEAVATLLLVGGAWFVFQHINKPTTVTAPTPAATSTPVTQQPSKTKKQSSPNRVRPPSEPPPLSRI